MVSTLNADCILCIGRVWEARLDVYMRVHARRVCKHWKGALDADKAFVDAVKRFPHLPQMVKIFQSHDATYVPNYRDLYHDQLNPREIKRSLKDEYLAPSTTPQYVFTVRLNTDDEHDVWCGSMERRVPRDTSDEFYCTLHDTKWMQNVRALDAQVEYALALDELLSADELLSEMFKLRVTVSALLPVGVRTLLVTPDTSFYAVENGEAFAIAEYAQFDFNFINTMFTLSFDDQHEDVYYYRGLGCDAFLLDNLNNE